MQVLLIMEKAYKNLWILFIAILGVLFLGFYKTYFSLFPNFDEISISLHLHSFLFLLWFALLFIQPYLIKKGKVGLHRLLGKLSIALVVLLVFSVLVVAKEQYFRELTKFPKAQCIANLIVPLPQIVFFAGFYILAIFNTKRTAFHMRYIVSASIVLIGPGIGRFFIFVIGMSFPQAVLFSFLVTELVALGLIVYDRLNNKNAMPYFVLLFTFLSAHIAWYFLPQSALWQTFCGKFIELLF